MESNNQPWLIQTIQNENPMSTFIIHYTFYYLPPAAEGHCREIIKCLPYVRASVRPFVTFLHKP